MDMDGEPFKDYYCANCMEAHNPDSPMSNEQVMSIMAEFNNEAPREDFNPRGQRVWDMLNDINIISDKLHKRSDGNINRMVDLLFEIFQHPKTHLSEFLISYLWKFLNLKIYNFENLDSELSKIQKSLNLTYKKMYFRDFIVKSNFVAYITNLQKELKDDYASYYNLTDAEIDAIIRSVVTEVLR